MSFPVIDPTANSYTNTSSGITYNRGPFNVWVQDGSSIVNSNIRETLKAEITSELTQSLNQRPVISTSESPPSSSSLEGDLWWDTDDLTLKVYHFDGNSYQWVAV